MYNLKLKVNLLKCLLKDKNIECEIIVNSGLITIESKYIQLVLYTYEFMNINNFTIVKIMER